MTASLTTLNPLNLNTAANYTFGNVTATGNISGTYVIGNGSQLTGVSAGASNVSIRAQAMTMSIILGS